MEATTRGLYFKWTWGGNKGEKGYTWGYRARLFDGNYCYEHSCGNTRRSSGNGIISALELVELVPHCACYNVAATTRITMITITEKRLILLLLQIMLVLLLLLLLARLPRLSAVEPSLCKRAGRLSMRLL